MKKKYLNFLKNKKGFFNRYLLILVIFSFILFPVKATKAQVISAIISSIPETFTNIKTSIKETVTTTLKKSASVALNTAIRNTLNRLAYDAAEDLFAGGEGQKPKIVTKDWGEYAKEIGDAAAGDFLDTLNTWEGINLCEPSLEIKANIGLGLDNQQRPREPNCTMSKMTESWKDEFDRMDAMKSEDFLQQFYGFLEPEGNSLSVSVSLMQGMEATKQTSTEEAKDYVLATKGEDEAAVSDAGGEKKDLPGAATKEVEDSKEQIKSNIGKTTGDALVDAANVFLNQLAIKAYQKGLKMIMSKGGDTTTDGTESDAFYNPDYDVASYYGSSKVQAELKQVISPRFDIQGDFDVLANLSSCSTTNTGTDVLQSADNCVIDQDFRQAISDRETVGEAMEDGYLKKDWVFTGVDQKANFNESYTYRSIMILRKYRIVPLGWEEAVLRANEKGQVTTLQDLVSCYATDDEYSSFSTNFPANASWCRGLVDPNWVLKAPLNYCAKSGYGYVLSKEVVEGVEVDGTEGTPSSFYVTRVDDYCADAKSCIKENSDGSCEAYGYCTEEERTWNFKEDSCEPVFNTCETFKDQESGKTVSYLKNTLDYDFCNASSVGCEGYSREGIYLEDEDVMDWKNNDLIYLKNVADCEASSENCDQLVSIKDNYGHNFIKNGRFSLTEGENQWDNCTADPDNYIEGCLSDDGYLSAYAADLSKPFNLDSVKVEVGPSDYNISGNSYMLSFYAKDCLEGDSFGFTDVNKIDLLKGDDWKYYRAYRVYPNNTYSGNTVEFFIDSNSCKIDDLKLEMGETATRYTEFANSNLIYQKMIPEYLWSICYTNPFSGNKNFTLKDDAPDICSNFARRCNADEVGCSLYTEADNSLNSVAARVSVQDQCDEDCNNYDIYAQKEDYFSSSRIDKFIPETAEACNASAVGCNEFTNLDELNQGAENKEYYKTIRQCIIPESNSCESFYTWQGSGSGSPQLVSFNLEVKTGISPILEDRLKLTESDSGLCNKDIFKLDPSHPDYNPDCYEFYDKNGNISYHLYSRTITCSNNCHPYRLTEKNIDYTIATEVKCGSSDATHWDSDAEVCYVCKNNGTWRDDYNACVYNAIPNLGETCQAEDYGCKEYDGNKGNNVKIVSADGFDSDYKAGWGVNSCPEALTISGESLDKEGKSIYFTADVSCSTTKEDIKEDRSIVRKLFSKIAKAKISVAMNISKTFGRLVEKNSSYSLKFVAKSVDNIDLKIFFKNGTNEEAIFNSIDDDSSLLSIVGDDNWHVYEVVLDNLDHIVDSEEKLVINIDSPDVDQLPSIYLDDIILTEIVDKYYVIKDSWVTPDVCYYDILDNYQGSNYNLGCSLYKDQDGNSQYLRQFSSLCQDSAVGCQLMLDTKNSTDNYVSEVYENSNIETEADEYIYAVYDKNHSCLQEDKGCERLGEINDVGNKDIFSDAYVINDPDYYDYTLCTENSLNCKSWINSSGTESFFKDPGEKLCEWRQNSENTVWAWYKKTNKKCDINNNGETDSFENVCNSSSDCYLSGAYYENGNGSCSQDTDCRLNKCENNICSLSGDECTDDTSCENKNICVSGYCANSCISNEGDYACDVSDEKTLGFGGVNGEIYQPDGWTGLCSASASTCTELIDPVSAYAVNEVVNPDFSDLDNDGEVGDYWEGNDGEDNYQVLNLTANRTYTFGIESEDNTIVNKDGLAWINCFDGENPSIPVYPIKLINDNNSFGSAIDFTIDNTNQHRVFNYKDDGLGVNKDDIVCQVYRNQDNEDDDYSVIVKEAIMDYQLDNSLDKTSCNGKSSLDNGCVMFNERSVFDSTPSELSYSAQQSYISKTSSPQTTTINDYKNANSLIKVKPDRICGSWLACETFVYDEDGKVSCYDVSECDLLDQNGNCANYKDGYNGVRTFQTSRDQNASGYSLVDSYYIGDMEEVGSNLLSYDFEDGFDRRFKDVSGSEGTDGFWIIDEPLATDSDYMINVNYPAEGGNFLKVQGSAEVETDDIQIQKGQTYVLNYLLNSSSLTIGDRANIEIYGVDDESGKVADVPINTFSYKTKDWERKIYEFKTSKYDVVRIRISTKNASAGSSFYIDDINIETALAYTQRNGEVEYISKTCRLFPKQDSLSCKSVAQSVISNGWQGYCLQEDPYYPGVCLMWYPVDVIGTQLEGEGKNSGYSGKTNLWYCTEADGDFKIAERRVGFNECYSSQITDPNADKFLGCGVFNKFSCDSSGCKEDGNDRNDETFVWADTEELAKSIDSYEDTDEYHVYANSGLVEGNCGDSDNYAYRIRKVWESKDYSIHAMCLPLENNKLGTVSNNNNNNFDTLECQPQGDRYLDYGSNPRGSGMAKKEIYNGWYEYNDSLTTMESWRSQDPEDTDPIFQIFEGDIPFSLNKYKIKCNELTQVVTSGGKNMAWALRTSYSEDTGTPSFFQNSSLNNYSYNREDPPFGSATIDGFDFSPGSQIYLNNKAIYNEGIEYSSGLPYGCSGDNCGKLGYCSKKEELLCLFGLDEGYNQCGEDGGSCNPLDKSYSTDFEWGDSTDVLKNIFLKSYQVKKYKDNKWDNIDGFDFSYGIEGEIIGCPDNKRSDENKWCVVYPRIENIVLKKGDQIISPNNNGEYPIVEDGIYSLSFNSIIDSEQTPLGDIVIAWDNASTQTISDQDFHPDSEYPHVISHSYKNVSDSVDIKIKISDNWGFSYCCSGGGCGGPTTDYCPE